MRLKLPCPLSRNLAVALGSAGVAPAVFGVPPKTWPRRQAPCWVKFEAHGTSRRGAEYVFSARTARPLPVRNERGEGRGEGHPTADTPAHLQARRPSSPQPSPPSAGGEGEDTSALNTYDADWSDRDGRAPPIP